MGSEAAEREGGRKYMTSYLTSSKMPFTDKDLEWLFHAKIRFPPALLDSERLTFKNNCVKSKKHRPTLSAASMQVNNSSFWEYKLFVDIRKRFLQERLQTGLGSLKSTYLQFSRCYIFASFRNNVGINCTLRRHAVLDFCRHQ